MAEMHVEMVAVERRVWSGTARMLIARTTEGDIGVLPGHEPTLGELVDGLVTVRVPDGDDIVAAVHGGFLSVTAEKVTVLAESAQLAGEVDIAAERQVVRETESGQRPEGQDAEDIATARARAFTRLRAAGQEV